MTLPGSGPRNAVSALNAAKRKIVDSNVLVHYDPNLPIRLAGDASAYGIGAVISHVMNDGTERPIAFASRTLLPSERSYSQIEKEALPLTTILGEKKGIWRWALKLSAYTYEIEFRPTQEHSNADCLPQLPMNCVSAVGHTA